MTRLPPSATRTGTLLPDTTLFRSVHLDALKSTALEGVGQPAEDVADIRATFVRAGDRHQPVDRPTDRREIWVVVLQIVEILAQAFDLVRADVRSAHTSAVGVLAAIAIALRAAFEFGNQRFQIGRASCRERVCQSV